MKSLLIATFTLGVTAGIMGSGNSISVDNIVTQQCSSDKKAEIVVLGSIRLEHPLGENTCGDLHSIEKIGLKG